MRSSSLGSPRGRLERGCVYALIGTVVFAAGLFAALSSAAALAMIAAIIGVPTLIIVFAIFGAIAVAMSLRGNDPVLDALISFTFLPGLVYLLFADRFDQPSWPGAIAAALVLVVAVIIQMMRAEDARQERWRHHGRKAALRRMTRDEHAASDDFFRGV